MGVLFLVPLARAGTKSRERMGLTEVCRGRWVGHCLGSGTKERGEGRAEEEGKDGEDEVVGEE